MIYGKYAPLYFDKGLVPVPIFPGLKHPNFKEWQDLSVYEDEEKIIEKYKRYNIGLLLGKPSGIIVIDVDTTDRELQQEIYDQLPPLYCGKVGDRNRGINCLFKYNGEVSDSWEGAVELLSTGSQSVMPPSPHYFKGHDKKFHSSGYSYAWHGKSLLDIDIDSLPDLLPTFIPWCKKRFPKGAKITGEGNRNNTLSAQASAAIFAGKDPTTIIKELLNYDSARHSPPLFTDKSESSMKNNSALANATRFFSSIYSSISRTKQQMPSWNDTRIEIIDTPKTVTKGYKTYKLPKMRGFAQELFEFIYKQSPVSRTRFSYASVIVIMGNALANRIRFESIYSNVFCMLLAPSGTGKNYPLKFPTKLFHQAGLKQLVRPGKPASDSAIFKGLENQPSRLDIIDEMSSVFIAMNNMQNSWQAGMQDAYADLFTAPGEPYGGKILATSDKIYGECFSPCVSLFGAMTIEDFKNSFNTNTMDKGLGGRFLYFPDDEQLKCASDKGIVKVPANIIETIKGFRPAQMAVDDYIPPTITLTTDAETMINEVRREFDKKRFTVNDTSKNRPLYNRMYEQFAKMLIIDTVSTNIDKPFEKMRANKDNVEWAYNAMTQITRCTELFLDDNLSGSHNEKNTNTIYAFIRNATIKGVSHGQLGQESFVRKIGGVATKMALQELIEYERIVAKTLSGKVGRPTKIYYSTEFAKEI